MGKWIVAGIVVFAGLGYWLAQSADAGGAERPEVEATRPTPVDEPAPASVSLAPIESTSVSETPPAAASPESPDDSLPTESTPGSPSRREAVATVEEDEGSTLAGSVVDDGGHPVASFEVTARFKPRRGAEWQTRELGTFERGEFVLEDLEPGRWKLEALAADHRSPKARSLRVPYDGERLVFTLVREAIVSGVVLAADGSMAVGAEVVFGRGARHDVDEEGRFRIGRKAGAFSCVAQHEDYGASEVAAGELGPGEEQELTLRLRVGGGLSGEVLDREGRPRVGWWVRIDGVGWEQKSRVLALDEAGRFAVERLAPGTYRIEAVEREEQRSRTRPVRAVVEIAEGEREHVVLGGVDENAIAVTGTVFRDGEPAGDVRVWAMLEGAEAFSSGSTVLADEQGRYALELPGPGRANFLVAPRANLTVPMTIDVSDEREQEIDLHVPGGVIAGRVVQTGEGRPKRRTVACSPEGRDPITRMYLSRKLKCEKDGSFRFDYLPAGSYRLSVNGVLGALAAADDVRVEEDGQVEGLVLEVGDVGEATITVLDAEGEPVSGAIVYAQDAEGHSYDGGMNAKTGDDGTQCFRRMTPGEYRFFALDGDLVSMASDVVLVESGRAVTATVRLDAGASAVVTVLDGGTPIGARLWVLDAEGRDFARAANPFDYQRYLKQGFSSTEYRVGPIPPGRYVVRGRVLDGRMAEREVEFRAGETVEVALEL